MKQEIPWNRFFLEAFIIVGSILLAFGIQAWWEETTERREELQILLSLRDELMSNRDELSFGIAKSNIIQSAALALLTEGARTESTLSGDAVDELIGNISWWSGSKPFEMSTIDALTQGGRLSLIQDQELMRSISRWQRGVETIQVVAEQSRTFFLNTYMPFMYEHAYIPQISNTSSSEPGRDDQDYVTPVPTNSIKTDHRSLVQNRQFQNLVTHKSWILDDILENYRLLELSHSSLIDLVDREIAN